MILGCPKGTGKAEKRADKQSHEAKTSLYNISRLSSIQLMTPLVKRIEKGHGDENQTNRSFSVSPNQNEMRTQLSVLEIC